jgi:AraC family transcriptional activator of mtrCDE
MDAVSHLIRLARLEARLDKRCLLGRSTLMDVAAHGERQAPFHVLLEGTCTLRTPSQQLELRAGDVVLIPSGSAHTVVTPGDAPVSTTAERAGDAFVTTRSAAARTPVIDLFCGHYTFGAGAGALLLRSLPEPLHVSFGESPEGQDVLRTLSTLMRGEARREGDGTAAILSALCTVVLTMLLRASRDVHTSATLWTAVGDERIARAVGQILADPGASWPIERLSRTAAMSRATFLRRFARSTGMTVGEFVVRARLMAAAELLMTTDDTVAAVAAQVGYRSESAFSRAFRSALGETPARFRRASTRAAAWRGHDG